jgi:hypothetical protein
MTPILGQNTVACSLLERDIAKFCRSFLLNSKKIFATTFYAKDFVQLVRNLSSNEKSLLSCVALSAYDCHR